MKVALHVNGSIEIELQPESEIERLVLSEMAARAARGQAVGLSSVANKADGCEPELARATFSVEK